MKVLIGPVCTQEKKKIHLVYWELVCQSKGNGGLGLRHLKENNSAFLMKVG